MTHSTAFQTSTLRFHISYYNAACNLY